MAIFAFMPIAVLCGVFVAVCVISVAVSIAQRRQMRLNAVRKIRRVFRPRVILGGKSDAAVLKEKAVQASDKLAG
jgi:hypothetical protein